ncbi:MAG: cytochrome b/b6 domain-containing protein [Geminicoccaceae bacterium]|jgi:cytochrome b subunit of formate dehydrogenase
MKPGAETGTRHKGPDRLFHWLMALSVILLTGTAFLPIIGVRFDWLPIHWISGIVLTVLVLFHLFRVALVHGYREMMPGIEDFREMAADIRGRESDLQSAKYDAYQKGYHWSSAIIVLALTVTGLLMLVKIDTPFWRRDPSLLSDPQWGIVYVIHGLAALILLFLIIVHIYFSILPEHRAVLSSMIAGRGPLHARGESHDRQR